jgi:kynurenine formamidase
MKKTILMAIILSVIFFSGFTTAAQKKNQELWDVYNNIFKDAKHIDLTHALEPVQVVWTGFVAAKFKPAKAGNRIEADEEFTYEKHGFVATAYELMTDQYGTQLDPPAHWDKLGATISDIPATYAIRPLVVIDIHNKVAQDNGYHLQVEDIKQWEKNTFSWT